MDNNYPRLFQPQRAHVSSSYFRTGEIPEIRYFCACDGGITAAKALKALMPTLPIIMLSNFAEDEFLKQEVVSAGIRQVVSKSDSQALVHAVEEVFRA